MKRTRFAFSLIFFAILLCIAGTVLAALDPAVPGAAFWRGDLGAKDGAVLTAVHSDRTNLDEAGSCRQIVANPQLDVKEFGQDRGTAEPWLYLKEIIYFTKAGNQAFDGYSLILPDGDKDDPSPNSDILSQIVIFDKKLDSVTVAYQRAMIDSNPTDKVYGELWRLTAEGEIDLDKPATYRVTRWQVADSEKAWKQEVVELDEAMLDELSGQEIALLLRTETDGGGTSAAEKEWVLFDDVTITTCLDTSGVYLPVVRSN